MANFFDTIRKTMNKNPEQVDSVTPSQVHDAPPSKLDEMIKARIDEAKKQKLSVKPLIVNPDMKSEEKIVQPLARMMAPKALPERPSLKIDIQAVAAYMGKGSVKEDLSTLNKQDKVKIGGKTPVDLNPKTKPIGPNDVSSVGAKCPKNSKKTEVKEGVIGTAGAMAGKALVHGILGHQVGGALTHLVGHAAAHNKAKKILATDHQKATLDLGRARLALAQSREDRIASKHAAKNQSMLKAVVSEPKSPLKTGTAAPAKTSSPPLKADVTSSTNTSSQKQPSLLNTIKQSFKKGFRQGTLQRKAEKAYAQHKQKMNTPVIIGKPSGFLKATPTAPKSLLSPSIKSSSPISIAKPTGSWKASVSAKPSSSIDTFNAKTETGGSTKSNLSNSQMGNFAKKLYKAKDYINSGGPAKAQRAIQLNRPHFAKSLYAATRDINAATRNNKKTAKPLAMTTTMAEQTDGLTKVLSVLKRLDESK